MSQPSGVRGFTITLYGQSGVVMDWFGLTDPFTQQLPLKINNTYSGTLWFQGAVVNPRSGYYSFSGIQMGQVNSGASNTLVMTWDAGVSGWIATSSPITDNLTLNIATYTSSNYTGIYDSGTVTIPNTLFNRYSGVIKVFGDIYNNDQPTPSLSLALGAGFTSGQTMSYAVSYILSGWESDIGASANIQTGSPSGANQISVSWGSIVGVAQYFLWRWSGSVDFTLYSGTLNTGFLREMDLVAVQATTGFTDNAVAAIQSQLLRHRTWQATDVTTLAYADAGTSLSAPQSRKVSGTTRQQLWAHGYKLSKNSSGTNLLGPYYGVIHLRSDAVASSGSYAISLQTGNDGFVSGTTIADSVALQNMLSGVWYRYCIQLGSSGLISASGVVHEQIQYKGTAGFTPIINIDDIFIVAQS